MYKRIEEIIEECTEYWTDKGDTYFDKEKFAKLIVKECAHIADHGHGMSGFELLEHFGVEE